MLNRRKDITLIAGVIALAGAMIPTLSSAGEQKREWWEKSHCLGLEGVSWIECQKAISQNKRDRKQGLDPAESTQWWEKSHCLGLEGASWIECQKALKQKKRERG